MSDEVTRQAIVELQAQVLQLRREYDAERAEVKATREERDAARAEVATLIGERNQSRIDAINWQQRTEALIRKVDVLVAERDTAQAEAEALVAECEGLQADLLAHPPETHQELAIERKQHLDLVEDYNRQVATISSLQSDLEKANKKASEAMEIENRLHAAIGQLEQCRTEMERLRKKNAEISKKVVSEEIIGILAAIEANAILAKSKLYSRYAY